MPTEIEQELARLRIENASLRLRKPREAGTARMMIQDAIRALDTFDPDEYPDGVDLIRRVLVAEYDAYEAAINA